MKCLLYPKWFGLQSILGRYNILLVNKLLICLNKMWIMKKQKILFYLFKWLALIFLVYLIVNENHSKFLMIELIGLVSGILIWEGIRDFLIKSDKTNF